MIVNCAVCECEIDDLKAVVRIDQPEEEPLFFCSQACFREFEENPELYAPGYVDENERPDS